MEPKKTRLEAASHLPKMAFVCCIVCLSILFLTLYHEILIWVGKGWLALDNAYSLVIFLLFIYMLSQKRYQLRRIAVHPNILPGFLIVALGCLILIIGKLTSTLLLQGISFIISLFGLIWLILGNSFARVLWIPVGYLIFMFYLFEEMLGNFSIYFQKVAAWIAAVLLVISGMPVALRGHMIELPHISLEVAKVCNGINHMLALVAIAIPFAFVSSFSRFSKIMVVTMAASIGVLANGLRVAMIGHWTKYHPDGPLHGPFNIFYVSFIIVFGLIVIAIVKLFSIKFGKTHSSEPSCTDSPVPASNKIPRGSLLKAIIVGIAIFSGTGIYLLWHDPQPFALNYRLEDFPMAVGPWQGKDMQDNNWPIKHISADNELRRLYRNSITGNTVGLYVCYFHAQHQGKELVSDSLSWLHLREKRLRLQLDDHNVTIARGKARGMSSQTYDGDNRFFYFWYVVDSRPYVDRYIVKLQLLLHSLLKGRINGAFVLVSLENNSSTSENADTIALSFIQPMYPQIESVFASM